MKRFILFFSLFFGLFLVPSFCSFARPTLYNFSQDGYSYYPHNDSGDWQTYLQLPVTAGDGSLSFCFYDPNCAGSMSIVGGSFWIYDSSGTSAYMFVPSSSSTGGNELTSGDPTKYIFRFTAFFDSSGYAVCVVPGRWLASGNVSIRVFWGDAVSIIPSNFFPDVLSLLEGISGGNAVTPDSGKISQLNNVAQDLSSSVSSVTEFDQEAFDSYNNNIDNVDIDGFTLSSFAAPFQLFSFIAEFLFDNGPDNFRIIVTLVMLVGVSSVALGIAVYMGKKL